MCKHFPPLLWKGEVPTLVGTGVRSIIIDMEHKEHKGCTKHTKTFLSTQQDPNSGVGAEPLSARRGVGVRRSFVSFVFQNK